jgi:hypothetical protein
MPTFWDIFGDVDKFFLHFLYKFCAFISLPPLSCLLPFETLLPVHPLFFFASFFPSSPLHLNYTQNIPLQEGKKNVGHAKNRIIESSRFYV